jgi:hypothetical protein
LIYEAEGLALFIVTSSDSCIIGLAWGGDIMILWLCLVGFIGFGFMTHSFYTDFLISIYKCIRYPVRQRRYGIHCWIGLPGEGKTLQMTDYILNVQDICSKNNWGCEVYTNYYLESQTAAIKNWQDIIKIAEAKKGREDIVTIIALDEIQNSFNSREWSSFPLEILSQISQSRKMNIQFLYTAQIYTHVEKAFRDLTNYVNVCKAVNPYYFTAFQHKGKDYEEGKKVFIPLAFSHCLAGDKQFKAYDSYKYIQSLKGNKYSERKDVQEKVIDVKMVKQLVK